MIDKLNIEEIKPSSRRYPGIIFEMDRESGDQILNVNQLLFDEISKPIDFTLNKGNKVVLYSKDFRKYLQNFTKLLMESTLIIVENFNGEVQYLSHSYLMIMTLILIKI